MYDPYKSVYLSSPELIVRLYIKAYILNMIVRYWAHKLITLSQDVPLYGSLTSMTCCVMLRYHEALQRTGPSALGQKPPPLPGPATWRKKLASAVTRRTVTLLMLSWLVVTCLVAPQAAFIQFYDLQVL